MKLRTNANAIITNNKGQLLIIKLKDGYFAGKKSIPGGGINPGELAEQTIVREVEEETGVTLTGKLTRVGYCELIDRNIPGHRIVLLYHGVENAEPFETEEATSEWISFEDVKDDLIPFALESIKLWQEGKNYFRIVN